MMEKEVTNQNNTAWLTINFTPREKRLIKFVARRIGITSCASYIRFKILEDVEKALKEYREDKKAISKPTVEQNNPLSVQ